MGNRQRFDVVTILRKIKQSVDTTPAKLQHGKYDIYAGMSTDKAGRLDQKQAFWRAWSTISRQNHAIGRHFSQFSCLVLQSCWPFKITKIKFSIMWKQKIHKRSLINRHKGFEVHSDHRTELEFFDRTVLVNSRCAIILQYYRSSEQDWTCDVTESLSSRRRGQSGPL